MNLNFLRVDFKGEVLNSEGEVLSDSFESEKILKSIKVVDHKYITSSNEIVEVFDFVFKVESIQSIENDVIKAKAQFGIPLQLNPNQIFLSYKDEFVIYDSNGVPAILTPQAQDELMDMADEFSDDDITLDGVLYPTPLWISATKDVSNSEWWSGLYKEDDTGWDLNGPSPVLVWAMQKFKLPKMRVAVLGCGKGHDANYLASLGHNVVGFDFSDDAISAAKELYGESNSLSWQKQDVFNINESLKGQFDLVLDHTLFCAIDPEKRNLLVKAWDFLLSEQGQILGIFYIMPKPQGPPYGATEAEVKDRISSYFRKDFWMRSRSSIERRMGQELVVLATKY